MIFVMMTAALIVALLVLTEPRVIEASAQAPKDMVNPINLGQRLSFSRNLIVRVVGDSAEHLNIHSGQTLKARMLKPSDRCALVPADIVVIKSKSKQANNPFRVRQIDKVENGNVYFKNPPKSEFPELKTRDLGAVYAKVTHMEALVA